MTTLKLSSDLISDVVSQSVPNVREKPASTVSPSHEITVTEPSDLQISLRRDLFSGEVKNFKASVLGDGEKVFSYIDPNIVSENGLLLEQQGLNRFSGMKILVFENAQGKYEIAFITGNMNHDPAAAQIFGLPTENVGGTPLITEASSLKRVWGFQMQFIQIGNTLLVYNIDSNSQKTYRQKSSAYNIKFSEVQMDAIKKEIVRRISPTLLTGNIKTFSDVKVDPALIK